MTVCVVGAGGREHALAQVVARAEEVVVCPGSPAMAGRSAEGHRVRVTGPGVPPEEVAADLWVIGPEMPLVDGLADRLRSAGKLVVGPGADGARLEGSKAFMKQLLSEAGVPTARFGVFDALDPAVAFLRTLPGPWVVKTDGLAAGKGVLVASTLAEAEADVAAKLSGEAFGPAGRTVVIEECLVGTECSLLALCDGGRAVPLVPARDAKRLSEGDMGPNTGGMGAFAPVPGLDAALTGRLMEDAVLPLVGALRARGIDYRGVLYAGLMLTASGPQVLEFNVRFGDPEAQVVLPLLADDPAALLRSVAEGRLPSATPAIAPGAAVCVVMAAAGYPLSPELGQVIGGLGPDGQLASGRPGVTVFHAGTSRPDPDGPFLTAGGRVLGVTGTGASVEAARAAAYAGVADISFEGCQVRGDIGVGVGGGGGAEGGAEVAVAVSVAGVGGGGAEPFDAPFAAPGGKPADARSGGPVR